jgi:hypothetical protein
MDNKCWELPENASRRPANWRTKLNTEAANVAHDGQTGPNVELLLSHVDDDLQSFPHDQSLLLHPNVWIRDTAATVHMSPHEEGMVNMKNTRGGITVGNGEVIVAKKTGDIPGVICDKHGNTLNTATISEVALTKGTPFNLFSLTKLMTQGWTLGGDGTKGITLTKQNNVLSFDIPIETPKGIVYAMYVRRSEVAAPALSTTTSIEKAHKLLGHQSEDATRKMAKT